MGEDLSAVDHELHALGSEPADLGGVIERYAGGVIGDLAAVDAELEALGQGVDAPFAPATVEQPLDEQGPASGEYSLGPAGSGASEPPALDVSGEMSLPDEHSGSYELPSAPADDGAADDPASAMAQALQSHAPEPPDTEQVHLDAFEEDTQHAASSSAPDVTQVVPTDTLVDGSDNSAELGLPSSDEVSTLSSEQTDIDMMFDELTSPGSAPPGPGSGAQPLPSDREPSPASAERAEVADADEDLSRFAENMSSPPPEGGYEDDEATAVFDAALFRDLEDDLATDEGAASLHDEVTRNASSNPPAPQASDATGTAAPASGESPEEAWEEELSIADLDIEEIDPSEFDAAVTGSPPAARSSHPPGGHSVPPPPPPAATQADAQEVEIELSETEVDGAEDGGSEGGRPSLIGRMFGRKKKD